LAAITLSDKGGKLRHALNLFIFFFYSKKLAATKTTTTKKNIKNITETKLQDGLRNMTIKYITFKICNCELVKRIVRGNGEQCVHTNETQILKG